MDVKFFIDENGKLILNYCKNIWIRIKDNNQKIFKIEVPKLTI